MARKQLSATKAKPIGISLSDGKAKALEDLALRLGVSKSHLVFILLQQAYSDRGFFWSDSLDRFVTVPED